MLTKIQYDKCLCCGSAAISHCLDCTDYTVSNELFEIWRCNSCTFRFTQNVPDAFHIGAYYQSADYVSHSNTRKGFVNQLYHFARKITLRSKKRLIEKTTGVQQGTLLDYGAGTGAFTHNMQQAGWSVTGLEPDETARKNALKSYHISLHASTSLEELPSLSYDAITLWHVLEHVHELHNTVEQFERILKSGGRLLIAVPNFTSYDAQYYHGFWAAYDVPRHLYHFSPKSMQLLLKQKGFVVEKVYPMWFDSLYVSMLSEKYKAGKINYLNALGHGLWSNLKTIFSTAKCSSVIYVAKKAG